MNFFGIFRGNSGLRGHSEKKSTNINFWGPETARWSGALHREGVVAEKCGPSLESLSSLGFEERNLVCPGNFAGMSQTPAGVQKVCAKKSSCAYILLSPCRTRGEAKGDRPKSDQKRGKGDKMVTKR